MNNLDKLRGASTQESKLGVIHPPAIKRQIIRTFFAINQNASRLCVWLAVLILAVPSLLAVTHDDTESLIPEFRIQFRGNGNGIPTLTVTYDAGYDEFNGTVWETYKPTKVQNGPDAGTGWVTPSSLYATHGVPLDVGGQLKIEGQNIAEYKIFINPPDSKYQPYVGMVERSLIQRTVTVSDSLPHTYDMVFKRSGEGGGSGGQASSAQAGWRNLKISLGYGKTGKPLGYVTFVRGVEAKLSDTSMEVSLANYKIGGVNHSQLFTPQMTYDFVYDATYPQPTPFQPGAYIIKAYDNATQPGQSSLDDDSHPYINFGTTLPIVSYVLDYASSMTPGPNFRTRVRRTEGTSEMQSDAYLLSLSSGMSFFTTCVPGPFGNFCINHLYTPPRASFASYSYDWIKSALASGIRRSKGYQEMVTFDFGNPPNPVSRTISLGAGLGDTTYNSQGNPFYLEPVPKAENAVESAIVLMPMEYQVGTISTLLAKMICL